MKVGDLVKVSHIYDNGLGIVTKLDYSTIHPYKPRFWVKIQGMRGAFPFLEHQLEVVNKVLPTGNECGNI